MLAVKMGVSIFFITPSEPNETSTAACRDSQIQPIKEAVLIKKKKKYLYTRPNECLFSLYLWKHHPDIVFCCVIGAFVCFFWKQPVLANQRCGWCSSKHDFSFLSLLFFLSLTPSPSVHSLTSSHPTSVSHSLFVPVFSSAITGLISSPAPHKTQV